MKNFISFKTIWLMLVSFTFFFFSCDNNEKEKTDKEIENEIDSSDLAMGIGGKIFIIPSPIQTAMIIQKSGVPYNKEILNKANKSSSYSTKFQKCLNLGIYGADLGYTTLYEQTQDALTYFKVINGIANDLGLASAFDKNLIERFQKNLSKKDSMLSLVSIAYRTSNDFLKNNEREEEAALVIAGGWIEMLHFAVNVMKTKNNEDIKRRIAEQKNILNNLIALLGAYQGNEEYSELLQKFNNLKLDFDKVQYKYIYKRPVTDEVNKITTITSESEITITPEIIQSIGEKVATIRGLIIA
ncbi:MAG: hypothetical protein V1781_02080 [Bacteroidota bacterium]